MTTVSDRVCRTINLKLEDHGNAVTPVPPKLEQATVSQYIEALLPGRKVEHAGRGQTLKVWGYMPTPTSLFFQAVHQCFSAHNPLTLRPEVLMHLIVHEVAATVKRNPQQYREFFIRSEEKEKITVLHNGLRLSDPQSPWQEAIALFDPAMRKAVPPGIMEHLLPDLSTHTPETIAASLVAFMDAASAYYDYVVRTRCGIPEIRLMGVAEDYRKILRAASQLSEVFRSQLGRYFDHLLPVLSMLAAQADGAPVDEKFWGSLYKFESHSGSENFNGWSTAFVNYVQSADDGQLVQKADDLFDWTDTDSGWGIKGLELGSVPSQVSTVPFIWDYFGKEIKMLFAGGVLAVENTEGSLDPRLSYAVLHGE